MSALLIEKKEDVSRLCRIGDLPEDLQGRAIKYLMEDKSEDLLCLYSLSYIKKKTLVCSFDFSKTKEGFDYWLDVDIRYGRDRWDKKVI